jgi:hypothetical protein
MLKDPQAGIDGQAVQIVFSRMVMQNEAQAATMIESIDPKYRRTALDVVLQNLAGKDPLAALALVEKYPGDAPENRQNEIISSLMKKDPQQGIAAAVKLTEMGKGTGFLRQGMNEWAAADKSAAEAWAAAYTGTGQTTARAWLLERKAAADPLGSLTEFNTLQQSVGNPQELSSTAAAIAHHLVRKDLPAAREWATGLPPGPVRDEVMSRVVDQWVQRDPGAASAWISALPEGKERDNSATRLAHQITHSDPPGAFEWARTIQNQEQRTNTLKDIVDEWLRQDSDAAKAAVETLPAEMRKGLPGFK